MPASSPDRRGLGAAAEAAAEAELQRHGLTTLARNAGFRVGELDLVMRDGGAVVFVEVRYRQPSRFGDGLLSVDRGKRRRLVRAAQAWLARHSRLANLPCRFDVVAVRTENDAMHCDWIRAAFTLDDL